MKSLNKLYKESGTTLSYKEWRKREDEKMASFDGLNIPSAKDSLSKSESFQETKSKMEAISGYSDSATNKSTFGINNKILIVAGAIIVGAVIYKLVSKND